MTARRQYAVLGPLPSGAETLGFLGCEMLDGLPSRDSAVVVVWVPESVAGDDKQVARLQRETAFVTQLRHPNIVRVFGLECFEEGWARVVAFGDGEPLSRALEISKSKEIEFPPRIAARIIADACDGVHYAHDEGTRSMAGRPIVHGGLRPTTLVVGFDGLCRITGYGASALVEASKNSNASYLAPEQVIGGKATASAATDIYALGAVFYTMLSGKAPFEDDDDIEGAIMSEQPAYPELEGLGGRLAGIAIKAMAKRGGQRYSNVAAMSAALLSEMDEDGLAAHEEVAAFMNELIPPDQPERVNRATLLASADDLDALTVLSHRVPPDGTDPDLFEAARPMPSTIAAAADGEEDSPPDDAAADGETGSDDPVTADAADGESATAETVAEEADDADQPTASAAAEALAEDTSPDTTSDPAPRREAETVADPNPPIRPLVDLQVPVREAMPREAETVIADGPPSSPPPRQAPDREATVPHGEQPHVELHASVAAETTSRIPRRRPSFSMDDAMALESTPAAIPRSPIREESITAFRKNVGDSSRLNLFLALGGVLILLVAVFYFSKPPEELTHEAERHHLPKEAVRMAMESSGAGELPSDEPDEQPPLVPPPTLEGGAAIEGELEIEEEPPIRIGDLKLTTQPEVDVYDGKKHLGRTPLQVELRIGRHKLRFTDKDKRINIYKQYRILPGGKHRDFIEFQKSELTVEAPEGANVLLNGTSVGIAPLGAIEIYQGQYHLKVNVGTQTWAKWFEAPPGRKINFKVTMKDR